MRAGIGRALAEEFLRSGDTVLICSRSGGWVGGGRSPANGITRVRIGGRCSAVDHACMRAAHLEQQYGTSTQLQASGTHAMRKCMSCC